MKENPCDYEYRYALKSQIDDWKSQGWKECGYAGHCLINEPVIFIRRLIKKTPQRNPANEA